MTTAFGSGDDAARAVAIQPDGKIVVAGYSNNGTNDDFAVARYNVDGSLDTTFSGDGRTTVDFGTGNDHANAVVIQSNGRIVLGGYAAGASNFDFALARLDADGTLNTSFGTAGLVTTDFGSGDDYVAGLALQPDGMTVAVGGANTGANDDFGLARYTTGGVLDTGFDGDGRQTVAFGSGDDEASAVVVQPDGKIVAAGFSFTGATYDFAVARLKAGGNTDGSFGSGGRTTTDFTVGERRGVRAHARAGGQARRRGVDLQRQRPRLRARPLRRVANRPAASRPRVRRPSSRARPRRRGR